MPFLVGYDFVQFLMLGFSSFEKFCIRSVLA